MQSGNKAIVRFQKDSCWHCDNYNLYQPKVHNTSPRQEDDKL